MGLVLCTNRYYDPQQGRFLTRDPMGYDGGVNLYGYTQNNPVNDIDPDGTTKDKGWCDDKLKKIENIKADIDKRMGEYDLNIGNLPERKSGDELNPSKSRWGHRKLIADRLRNLRRRQKEYHDNCPGGGSPVPVPVPILVPVPAPDPSDVVSNDRPIRDDGFWLPIIIPWGRAAGPIEAGIGVPGKAMKCAAPVFSHAH